MSTKICCFRQVRTKRGAQALPVPPLLRNMRRRAARGKRAKRIFRNSESRSKGSLFANSTQFCRGGVLRALRPPVREGVRRRRIPRSAAQKTALPKPPVSILWLSPAFFSEAGDKIEKT